uniref:Putative uncharacterized protein YNL205C n=1 Tax=Saccharomyces cerevisiae (strain ATCC 204508 / S288c) TaxID=559292 RepID=YNU5_YEAST|nr:RecName: Full=Putative uncharacterized protein YNL205C [Saccharomyces cerevisiae S288C]AAT93325.1 YNL205C [Saccharomyces cerevisiae]CAA55503.1 N1350 [Saccharomyces cerevisiae]CAA96107.1 unnamed protein product [Saccharomyces cerevisiae]
MHYTNHTKTLKARLFSQRLKTFNKGICRMISRDHSCTLTRSCMKRPIYPRQFFLVLLGETFSLQNSIRHHKNICFKNLNINEFYFFIFISWVTPLVNDASCFFFSSNIRYSALVCSNNYDVKVLETLTKKPLFKRKVLQI